MKIGYLDIDYDVQNLDRCTILFAVLTYGNQIYIAVNSAQYVESFVKNQFQEVFHNYVQNSVYQGDYNVTMAFDADEALLLKFLFDKAAEHQVDLISPWYLIFEYDSILTCLHRLGGDHHEVLATEDYKDPEEVRRQLMTPLSSIDITVKTRSGIPLAAGLCNYANVSEKKPTYAMVYIIKEELGESYVFDFEPCKDLEGLVYSQALQTQYPLQAILTSVIGCLSMRALNDKLGYLDNIELTWDRKQKDL